MSGCTITLTGNLWARVRGGPGVLRLVDDSLTYRPKGYVFSPAYKNGFWDGTIRLLKRDRFPAGLVEHVVNALKLSGYAAEVQDDRARPGQTDGLFPEPPRVKLEEHQEKAVAAACKAGRGVIHHPVGAGKSIVLLEIVRRLSVPTLALVHRKDLLYQLADTARGMFGMGTGIIGDGHWEDGAPLTVATFQSLHSRLKGYDAVETRDWLKRFQAVHIDEGHHIEAATYEKVLSHLPEAYYRFSYSATPFRSDDKGTFLHVVGWTGPVIHKLTSEKGIKAGRLVPADIFIVTPTPGVRPRDTDYQKAYETGITRHEGRNKLTIRLAQATRRRGPTLILVERLEHGETLAAGLGIKFLSGSTPGYERNLAWQAMRDGGADCLVASIIADEGLDIPNIEWLILAGGGRAAHRQIQRIGRGLRRIEGKDRLRVFDYDDRGYYLGRHARARRRTYDKEPAYNVSEVTPEELDKWLGDS